MDVKVVDNAAASRFEANVNGVLAVAEYRLQGDTLSLTHTEVPESLRGEGIGEALARGALDSARARKLKVVPACRFIAAFIQRHTEYQDLLAPGA